MCGSCSPTGALCHAKSSRRGAQVQGSLGSQGKELKEAALEVVKADAAEEKVIAELQRASHAEKEEQASPTIDLSAVLLGKEVTFVDGELLRLPGGLDEPGAAVLKGLKDQLQTTLQASIKDVFGKAAAAVQARRAELDAAKERIIKKRRGPSGEAVATEKEAQPAQDNAAADKPAASSTDPGSGGRVREQWELHPEFIAAIATAKEKCES